jgi:4'-phosphopantetheinyl transferase
MASYRRVEDRERFLTGRAVVRAALAEGRGCPVAEIDIVVGPSDGPAPGRPYVAGGPSFSISHSGRWVLVAVSSHGSVGVDVEGVGGVATSLDRVLHAVPAAEAPAGGWTPASFVRAWTRREAVLKAVGLGLLAPRDDVLLSRADEPPRVRATAGGLPPPAALSVVDIDPDPGPPTDRRETAHSAVALAFADPPAAPLTIDVADAAALLLRQGVPRAALRALS